MNELSEAHFENINHITKIVVLNLLHISRFHILHIHLRVYLSS